MQVVISCYLGILALWDVRYRKMPAWSLITGAVLLTGMGVWQCVHGTVFWWALLFGVIPGLAMLIVARCTRMAGYADGVVLAELGLYLGWRNSFLLLCISLMLSAVCCILLLALRRVQRQTQIPFLPFLFAGFMMQSFGMRG